MKSITIKKTAEHFSKEWWNNKKILIKYQTIINDLLIKLRNPNKKVSTQASQLNRGLMTCEYILNKYKRNSKILEMACGLGFVTHVLTKKGYDVKAFDISDKAIDTAKNLANQLGQNSKKFYVSNEKFLKNIKSNSLDVVIGLGYFRYINPQKQNKVYKECKRILKKNGTLILDHQNELFEMFALNNESIKYWSKFIESYCNINNIFKKGELLKKINTYIKVPIRKRAKHSISSKTEMFGENPLIYNNKIKKLGFNLIEIKYPHTEIIPPFLHDKIPIKKLYKIQNNNCYKLSKNWKSMFMCYQFLSFLKVKNK